MNVVQSVKLSIIIVFWFGGKGCAGGVGLG